MKDTQEIDIIQILNFIDQNNRDKLFAKQQQEIRDSGYLNEMNIDGPGRLGIYRNFFRDDYIDGNLKPYPYYGTVIRQAKSSFYYRGEKQLFPTTEPTINRRLKAFRKKPDRLFLEKFIAELRIQNFYQLILKFNHTHQYLENGITVLYKQLAQHYGLETDWLDLTSDFEVALFFACCKFDEKTGWLPLDKKDINKSNETKYGVIYSRKSNLLDDLIYEPNNIQFQHFGLILPIGFQPFMRCHLQSGYTMQMSFGETLNDNKTFDRYIFKHDEGLCYFIYEKMKKGKLVYPHEGLSEIAPEIELLKIKRDFSHKIFDETFETFEKNYEKKSLLRRLNEIGISIKDNHSVDISDEKINKVNSLYRNFDIENTYGIRLGLRDVRPLI